jgi:probable F420-dependent oxidoreductase
VPPTYRSGQSDRPGNRRSSISIAVVLPSFGPDASPESIASVARTAEELDFYGLGVADHVLVPYGEPVRYERIFEVLTTLAYAAALTHRIRLISAILVLPMRNPFIVAKQAATIDVMSGGRLTLGVAAGWNRAEFENVGAEFAGRGGRLDEQIQLIRHLFSGSREPFRGAFYRYTGGAFEPLPIQGARLPILIGGSSDAALRRVASLGDSWQSDATDVDDFKERLALLRSYPGGRAVDVGARIRLGSTESEMREACREWIRAGARHLMLNFGSVKGYEDRMRLFTETVRPQILNAT